MIGEKVHLNQMHIVLDRFKHRFVKHNYEHWDKENGGRNLIWCNFTFRANSIPIEEFSRINISPESAVYYYSERDEEMYFTTFSKICEFVESLEPWDQIDAEIFDETLNWVIVITHEDFCLVKGIGMKKS